MTRTVAQKMGVQEGTRAFFVNAPKPVVDAMGLPRLDMGSALRGAYDYLHLFVTTQAEMDRLFPGLKRHLKATGMLWLSWPKNKQLHTDLALPDVIKIGYGHGLVESTCLSVDTIWSGLKFTHPKNGKEYHNRFGQLPAV